ncbi:MAG: hypothetical protein WC304_03170 [Candidatus Gracilibacteria bacterium]|jgi:NACalpha-BTF3-like transcription factor
MPPTPTLTFRTTLRNQATKKAQRMGIPLSLVLNNALRIFLKSDDTVVIGKPQLLTLSADLQKKADALGELAQKAISKKRAKK